MNDITIYSVNYFSKKYLLHNYKLLYPEFDKWIVVNNPDVYNKLEELPNDKFEIITGIKQIRKSPRVVGAGALQHSTALNLVHKIDISTRFVLFLDPDFFIFIPLQKIINHMLQNNIYIFGAPYIVRYPKKYPDKLIVQAEFPAPFCMMIDTQHISLLDLDFAVIDDVKKQKFGDPGIQIYNKYHKNLKIFDVAIPCLMRQKDMTDGCIKYKHIKNDDQNILKDSEEKIFEMDPYYWNNKPFGIHCHMKMHHEMNRTRIERFQKHVDATTKFHHTNLGNNNV